MKAPYDATRHIPTITPREVEVWRLITRGESSASVAAKLGLSTKTVDSHREKLKEKLLAAGLTKPNGCATAWLVSLGFQYGLMVVTPDPRLTSKAKRTPEEVLAMLNAVIFERAWAAAGVHLRAPKGQGVLSKS